MTQSNAESYPVTIRGDLKEPISRWLFLVKWLLIIPHLIVLLFLAIGVVISLIISFFAILFTGKYPRGLFDFNVGVMRWGWRVGFYSYEALGTDKYPPFSLDKDDNYPADLDVAYPEKLNNFLVLVKWILAIPHLVILAIFQGGSGWGYGMRYGGLQTILVLILAIINLFTGKYPKDLFDFNMGINYWSNRVCAYILLMTDKYPPFRFGK